MRDCGVLYLFLHLNSHLNMAEHDEKVQRCVALLPWSHNLLLYCY